MRLPRRARGPRHPGAEGGGEPARVRDRHHRRGRRASSGSWRSRPGARCSATPSTPASTCSSPRSSTSSPKGRSVDFSGEVVPGRARGRPAPLRLRGRRATGRTWAPLEAYLQAPPGHPRRQGRRSTSTASRCGRASGSARAPRSTRGVESMAPAVIGDNCAVGPGRRCSGAYTTLGRQRPRRRGGRVERSVVARQHLPRARGAGSRARRRAVRVTCAGGAVLEPGAVLGDECLVGPTPRSAAGVKVYPFKTVEAGAIVNSSIVWESRGARSLFGRDGVPGIANVDISPELGRAAVHGLGVDAREGRHRHHLAATPAGPPGCSSGRSWSGCNAAGVQRRRPRGGHRAGDPLPRPRRGQTRGARRCASTPTTPSRS